MRGKGCWVRYRAGTFAFLVLRLRKRQLLERELRRHILAQINDGQVDSARDTLGRLLHDPASNRALVLCTLAYSFEATQGFPTAHYLYDQALQLQPNLTVARQRLQRFELIHPGIRDLLASRFVRNCKICQLKSPPNENTCLYCGAELTRSTSGIVRAPDAVESAYTKQPVNSKDRLITMESIRYVIRRAIPILFGTKRRMAVTAALILFLMYLSAGSDDATPDGITGRSARSIASDAKDGEPEAQVELGRRYYEGDGLDQDYERAYDLFHQASEQNYAPAFAYLGEMASHYNIPVDHRKEAKEFWKRGVELDDSECARRLGLHYLMTRPIRNIMAHEGFELLRKSNEQGNRRAQFDMGKIYFTGISTKPERNMFQPRSRSDVGRINPLFRIVKDYEAGAAYIEPLALDGDPEAIQFLAEQLFRRRYGSKWSSTALDIFQKEGQKGNADAQVALTYIYFRGELVDEAPKVGYKWLQKAVRQDDAAALNAMGVLRMNGTYLEKDFKLAEEWFIKAMERDSTEAEVNIGIMHLNGWGRPPDKWAAHSIFQSAADKGNKRGEWLAVNIRSKELVEWREWFKGVVFDLATSSPLNDE